MTNTLRSLAAGLGLACATVAFAATDSPPSTAAAPSAAPAVSPITAEMKRIVAGINAKVKAGKRTAADLAPDIAAFDALLARHAGDKSEDIAQVAFVKGTLYLQVLNDQETGRRILEQVKADYPGTKAAENVERLSASMMRAKEIAAIQSGLIGKQAPELNFKWASREGLAKLSSLKGKVVVLDFWATWCGPCIASFPHVRDLTAHYRGAPVEVLGVTSIQGQVMNLESKPIDTKGDPDREIALIGKFMKSKDMTWTVAVSEEEVFNLAYGVRGIPYVAIIAPDGTVRHSGLNPHNPQADIDGKVAALLKEFNLPVPR